MVSNVGWYSEPIFELTIVVSNRGGIETKYMGEHGRGTTRCVIPCSDLSQWDKRLGSFVLYSAPFIIIAQATSTEAEGGKAKQDMSCCTAPRMVR
jgi:hypothetical protein